MATTIKIELSFDNLIEAISLLNFEEKSQLKDIIEQQIFEAEEKKYQDNLETKTELELVRNEYKQGKYLTLDEFLASPEIN